MKNMKTSEKWNLFFSEKRFRERSATIKEDGRNPFENDYGRLISSAPIRRLQDKTQVFPLDQSDFIRTRLTHSLEVSYIGSSIGQSIEKILIDRGEIQETHRGFLSSLLRVSGLVHDLGNPPFGHFGEEAIKRFFEKYFKEFPKGIVSKLSEQEKADLLHFDGNVQTLRILTKLYYFGDEWGYNLSYPSIASIIKYPVNSLEGNKKEKEVYKHKFGYFCSEEDRFEEINKELKLDNKRFPIVYLLEAADDIAYSAADIEDGVNQGIISIDDIRKIFNNHLKYNKYHLLCKLDTLINQYGSNSRLDQSLIVQKFRIECQKVMIEEVIKTFVGDSYQKIMDGTFNQELIYASKACDVRKAYKQLQREIFNNRNIVKKELGGWQSIQGLLEIFVRACENGS